MMIPAEYEMSIEAMAVHPPKSYHVMSASPAGKAAAEVDTQCDLSHHYFTYLSFQPRLFTLLPFLCGLVFGFVLFWGVWGFVLVWFGFFK